MNQVEIDFTPGLVQQYPDWMDLIRASVHGCGRQFKAIAADLDLSPSNLSRKLNPGPNDPHFPLSLLPALMEATGDHRPIHWLIERYLEDADAKRKRALDQVVAMAPQLMALMKACRREA